MSTTIPNPREVVQKRIEAAHARYTAAAHGMQSGVAAEMGHASNHGQRHPDTEPKHLRVGVNSALVETGALAKLLLGKGVFTEPEYFEALADVMEAERDKYQDRLRQMLGAPSLTLA